ncbi:MAG: hypothetical protein CM1200mP29_11440 [Verrucomicrobiota bacterium]|nr:MAG: hypothetical protein CM1200mP29_11440 [Verrucomicrobiota bacterium]
MLPREHPKNCHPPLAHPLETGKLRLFFYPNFCAKAPRWPTSTTLLGVVGTHDGSGFPKGCRPLFGAEPRR